jgi:hypothetical protein
MKYMDIAKTDIYYTTYLCTGIFHDKHNIAITRKVKIALDYPIIQTDEWEREFVKKDELEKYLSSKCDKDLKCQFCCTIPSNIGLIPSDTFDLFMEESYDVSMDGIYRETFSEYILVEKNYIYIIDE